MQVPITKRMHGLTTNPEQPSSEQYEKCSQQKKPKLQIKQNKIGYKM